MLNHVSCDFCGKRACEVEHVVTIEAASICNECVSYAARKMGLLPPPSEKAGLTSLDVEERLTTTMVYTVELEAHPDQKYDIFLLLCLLDRLRSMHWNLAIELGAIRRIDGFNRNGVAAGGARIGVSVLVRSNQAIPEAALRMALEDRWAELTALNAHLVNDKGTRDLLEPRLASLAAYVAARRCGNTQD